MKASLTLLLMLFAHAVLAFGTTQQDIENALLNHPVVLRGYYLGTSLSFDQTGHLTSPALQGFGPADARIYVTDVHFEPDLLTIAGKRTFPAYDAKDKEFRVALLQEDTTIKIALPAGQPIADAVPAMLRQVFLTTAELQEMAAACPAEERKQFEDELTILNQKRSKAKPHDKSANAEVLSDVPEMCLPMGERAYMVGRGVRPPKALKTPDPAYTDAARDARIQGSVVLFLVVDAQGVPTTVYVGRSLNRDLDRAAVEAVKHWTFAPAKFKGTAIPVAINAEINFRLY